MAGCSIQALEPGTRQWDRSMNATFVVDTVRTAFSKIMADYGFVVVESDDSSVRLNSSAVSIDITYDWRNSYEVGIGLCEVRNGVRTQSIPFNLGEVFRELRVPDSDRVSFIQSSRENEVVAFLNNAADNLDRYCQQCLAGDSGIFGAIAKRRGFEAIEYTHKVQLASVRERADKAWQQKKYREFVGLMGGFVSWLPESDKKKLEYALRHCGPETAGQ